MESYIDLCILTTHISYMQIVAKTNVQLSRFYLLFDNTPVGVGPQTKMNRIETALNTRLQSTPPLNPSLTMINIRRSWCAAQNHSVLGRSLGLEANFGR